MKRIDQLTPGSIVMLAYADGTDRALFRGITGTGNDRYAQFTDSNGTEWDAYRFRGGWAYGSSGQRLRLVQVITEGAA
jgi:hypothetical protein